MHPLLKNDKENIRAILDKTVDLAEDFYNQQSTWPPSRNLEDIKLKHLPQQGIGAEATLDLFKKNYAAFMHNGAGARYFVFVTGGSTPASVAGDWLVRAYDQNTCGSNDTI